jgi:hypothetical protein
MLSYVHNFVQFECHTCIIYANFQDVYKYLHIKPDSLPRLVSFVTHSKAFVNARILPSSLALEKHRRAKEQERVLLTVAGSTKCFTS